MGTVPTCTVNELYFLSSLQMLIKTILGAIILMSLILYHKTSFWILYLKQFWIAVSNFTWWQTQTLEAMAEDL
jgi:hypothetical protein